MTKKQTLFFGFAVLLIAVIFTVAGCGDADGGPTGGGGGITTTAKVKFIGTSPNARRSFNARQTNGIMAAATTVEDFAPYTTFYNTTLDGKLVRKITPTSFKVNVSSFYIMGDGGNLDTGGPLLDNVMADFAQNVPLQSGEEIFLGTYDFAELHIIMPIWYGNDTASVVEFSLPDNKTETVFNLNYQLNDLLDGRTNPDPATNQGARYSNGKITAPLGRLLSNGVRYFLAKGGQPTLGWGGSNPLPYTDSPAPIQQWFSLYFGGDTRKLVHTDGTSGNEITMEDVYPTWTYEPGRAVSFSMEGQPQDVYLVPFSPATVTEETTAVQFEIYWDLTDLIEQYRGTDDIADTADDVFVLRNGWWDAISIQAVIE